MVSKPVSSEVESVAIEHGISAGNFISKANGKVVAYGSNIWQVTEPITIEPNVTLNASY